MSSDDSHPFGSVNRNTNSSARRKEPDEKCEDQFSPDSKRLHVAKEIENKSSENHHNKKDPDNKIIAENDNIQQRRKVCFHAEENSANCIVQQCLSAVFEEYKQRVIPREAVRERWRKISKLALQQKRQESTRSPPSCPYSAPATPNYCDGVKRRNDMYLDRCSAEQIDTIIRLCFRRCPIDVSYEEKLQSIKSYRDKDYKKDSRKWLHKSSRRAQRVRDEREHPDKPPAVVPPKKAISQENFRLLLEDHDDGRVGEYLADTTPDVDTNTSAFDRINLGAFYEEHQRQKELLEEKEEWNQRRPQARKQSIRKSVRYNDLTSWKPTLSLPNIPTEINESDDKQLVSPEKDNRLREEELSRHYMAFNSQNNEDYGTMRLKRSLSDSMLDKVNLRASRSSISERYDSRGMLAYVDPPSPDSLHLPSAPVTDINTNYCVSPVQNPTVNDLRATEVEECVTWEEIDRNAMARYNYSPVRIYNPQQHTDSRAVQQDQFSVPDSTSETSVDKVCNRNGKPAHSLSPSSGDERLNQF